MSSSVLRNVIHPKQPPVPGAKPASQENPAAGPESAESEMGLILSVLVENAPVAMAMFDEQMRYLLANRQWIEEFSLQAVQPLTGRSQYEVFPSLHAGWRQVYERALQGHVVRSEHDALAGPDGRRIIYRWEVRPWRRKKIATVGGVMVTCEKFVAPILEDDEAESEQASPPEEKVITREAEVIECALPMVLLDDHGVVHEANAAAAALCLARGFQEGASPFWDIFCDGRDMTALKQQTLATLVKIAALPGTPAQLLVVREKPAEGAEQCPSRWLLSPLRTKDGTSRFTALGLPDMPLGEAPQRMTVHIGAPPNLPALASAVASVTQAPLQSPPPLDPGATSLELRKLQDDLARARQELRTLHEAERTFAQREARVRQYLEALPCGVLVLDELGAPTFQNEQIAKLLGRPILRTETVEHWLAAACPNQEHREQVATLWRDDVWRRQLTRTFSLATADGLLKELEFKPVPLVGGALLISIQDTTEICRHEEQLRATEAKFRTLLHESSQAIVLTDKSGAVFEVNHQAEALLGRVKSELRRYPLDTWLDPLSGAARRELLRSLHAQGERYGSLPVTVLQADAAPIAAIMRVAQVIDAEQAVHCTIHFLEHAVEPKPAPVSQPAAGIPPADHASLSSAPRTLTLTQPLLQSNVNGRVCGWSERAAELLGYPEDEAMGKPLHQFFRPSDASGLYAELTQRAARPEDAFDFAFFGKTGARGICHIVVAPRGMGGLDFELNEQQTVAAEPEPAPAEDLATDQPAAAIPDFSPQRHWPIADLQREKLLLSETHHRIKNHLQIISSLLNLELNSITDERARNALRSSQNRVRAIGALHQHLHQLALGNDQPFSQFAQELVEKLRDCYQVPADRVLVHFNMQDGAIQQEWLMPLALTLNETLSNSFEHGYPNGKSGQINVTLSFHANGGEFVVADDGVGMPDSFHIGEGSGLGLKILSVFAEQMRGEFAVTGREEGGTEIRLRFPIASADI